MDSVRVLGFAGSTREGSYNKALVRIALQGARGAGAEITYLDLRDLPLPLFDEDLERQKGAPRNATLLTELFKANRGFLISSPEYSGSVSGVLKNVIDWVSRVEPKPSADAARGPLAGKVAAIMSAATGSLGGVRGLIHLRSILNDIGVIVLPDYLCIPRAHSAFDAYGRLNDERYGAHALALGMQLTITLRKLGGAEEYPTCASQVSGMSQLTSR